MSELTAEQRAEAWLSEYEGNAKMLLTVSSLTELLEVHGEAVAKATLEKSRKAMCRYCASGIAVRPSKRITNLYIHTLDDKDHSDCAASPIRALEETP